MQLFSPTLTIQKEKKKKKIHFPHKQKNKDLNDFTEDPQKKRKKN